MKHNLKITLIILGMFILTQFIGLYVVNFYSPIRVVDGQQINVSSPKLPFGMESPEITNQNEFYFIFPAIIIAFIIAIGLMFALSKFNAEILIKLWFFVVVVIALGISFNSFFPKFAYTSLLALIVAVPLAFQKIYGKDFFIHNFTELFIYPGIAAVFVPILNFWTVLLLLIFISIYDVWAVWHSGIMQKMANYQINKLNIFSGFFIPYADKKNKELIKKLKNVKNVKNSKIAKKIKVNLAILGGGDVIFPIITSGVMLKTFGLFSALFVLVGATMGLTYLFISAKKKKFYPAMPFITGGIFLGLLFYWISTFLI